MLNNRIKKISNYIDQLNKEKKPNEHNKPMKDNEDEKLMETVRLIKSLKEVEYPKKEFNEQLTETLSKQFLNGNASNNVQKIKKSKKVWKPAVAVIAAALVIVVTLNFILPQTNINIVYAMEQAFGEVKAYHGIVEITQTNEEGIVTTQAVREVWADKDGNYYVKELEGTGSGITTINNGQKKWQIDTDLKEIYQFPAFPDPYHFTFEIGSEIENVKNALEVKVVGEAEIAGRETSILSVRPQGGDSYRLWVDQETNIPLQKESAFQNAIQYKVTYKDIKFLDSIPKQLISYQLPKGYKEITSDTEQFVGNLDEAAAIAGFIPKITDILPEDFVLSKYSVDTENKEIKTYYLSKDKQKTAVIAQHKATGNLKPDSSAILGKVNNNTAEISTNAEIAAGNMGGGTYGGITGISSIRWQEDGMEYTIYGELTMENLSNFAESISQGEVSIPNSEAELQDKPQVEVPYDLEVEKNEQKSVDAGHSPWKLDPVFVTQVFASLLISPGGIVGDYPIAYEDINIIKNNGEMAIAEIKGDVTTADRVYLKRLVRQDSTGIWTVIGYDPVKK